MNMMKTMAMSNSNIGTGRSKMKMMGNYGRLLDKIIVALYWENKNDGYINGYIKRYMELYGHNHNQVKEDQGGKATGELAITELSKMSDAGVVPEMPALVK